MHAKQRNEAIRHVVAYVFTIAMVFLAVTPFKKLFKSLGRKSPNNDFDPICRP